MSALKMIANVMYSVGIVICVVLAYFVLFGANLIPYPDPNAMIQWSMHEYAIVGLAVGAIPMILACMAVYKFNKIKQSQHRKRNLLLVFLPGFLCGVSLLTVIGFYIYLLVGGLWIAIHQGS